MPNDLLLALRALNYAQLRQLAAQNRLSEALDAQHAALDDPDAQCPEHGCSRWRCDAAH